MGLRRSGGGAGADVSHTSTRFAGREECRELVQLAIEVGDVGHVVDVSIVDSAGVQHPVVLRAEALSREELEVVDLLVEDGTVRLMDEPVDLEVDLIGMGRIFEEDDADRVLVTSGRVVARIGDRLQSGVGRVPRVGLERHVFVALAAAVQREREEGDRDDGGLHGMVLLSPAFRSFLFFRSRNLLWMFFEISQSKASSRFGSFYPTVVKVL